MRHHLLTFRVLALLVLLALVTARIGTVSRSSFVAPLQNYFSNKDQITGDGVKKSSVFCKTKTLPEVLPPVEEGELLPPFPPELTIPGTALSGAAPEGIGREIFIPPERLG